MSENASFPALKEPGQMSHHPGGHHVRVVVEQRGSATKSLLFGLVALMLCWVPLLGLASWVLAPVGLCNGLAGFTSASTTGAKLVRIAGIATSGAALVICFQWLIMIARLFGS